MVTRVSVTTTDLISRLDWLRRSYSSWCTVGSCAVKAKFHYTGPTGPDRTRADPHGPARTNGVTRRSGSARVSDKVRGLCLVGSGRARVVEFSYKHSYWQNVFSSCGVNKTKLDAGQSLTVARPAIPLAACRHLTNIAKTHLLSPVAKLTRVDNTNKN